MRSEPALHRHREVTEPEAFPEPNSRGVVRSNLKLDAADPARSEPTDRLFHERPPDPRPAVWAVHVHVVDVAVPPAPERGGSFPQGPDEKADRAIAGLGDEADPIPGADVFLDEPTPLRGRPRRVDILLPEVAVVREERDPERRDAPDILRPGGADLDLPRPRGPSAGTSRTRGRLTSPGRSPSASQGTRGSLPSRPPSRTGGSAAPARGRGPP